MAKEEKTLADVPVPYGLDTKAVSIAQDLVVSRLQDGFTVADFCSRNSISTKTFYVYKEKQEFNDYVEALNEILIPSDVLSAVDKFRLKVMQFVEKETMSKDEMNQFYTMFKSVIDASNRMEAERLGLNVSAGSTANQSAKSVEEKKAVLLARLKTSAPAKEEINEDMGEDENE
ncbi:hypothetical protein BABA_02162 [Neobacillus bataviensis LMG 21833]|uniref:Homeodomain phBC6A51-type domain-containing protein n=1 Tax=Neobacillus bataviensis LMG 21833 TaxID=1117379 RepID=K6DSS4_9BACI|nr:hypothetical protein [Neobacillus bataviensis]EKN71298.1 hypothetical protein BABA_02162 [Neobacillus bataviensis LMG 21833]